MSAWIVDFNTLLNLVMTALVIVLASVGLFGTALFGIYRTIKLWRS